MSGASTCLPRPHSWGRLVLALFIAPLLAQPPGSITGTVTSLDSNVALSGVHLVAASQRPDAAPILLEATSADDGRYSIPNVPPGDYSICAQYKPAATHGSRRDLWQMSAGIDQEIAYLDPCDWSSGIQASVGTSEATVNIRLERGVSLTVLVDDPVGALDPSAAALQIFVKDSSGSIRAALHPFAHVDGPHRYRAVVPKSGRYSLVVHARGVSLVDHPSDFELPIETASRPPVAARLRLR